MKEEILKAIFKVKKTHGRRFEEKGMKNIHKIRKMTNNAHLRNLTKDVIAVMDTSFFRNGRKAFLITETGFYCIIKKENLSFPFSKIDYAEPASGGNLILHLMDDSAHKIHCGSNKYYLANVIDNIVDIMVEADEKPANTVLKEDKKETKPSEPIKKATLEEELAVNVFPDLEKAAAKGDIKAIRRLGEIYLNGIGVKEDSYTAYLWYLKGKDLEDTESITALGEIYLNGTRKFPEDPYMALRMFEKAAEMGSVHAQMRYEEIKDGEDLYF